MSKETEKKTRSTSNGMRVLAADPGYDRLGVAVLEKTTQGEVLIYSDCITSPNKLPFPERLSILGNAFEKLLIEHTPHCVALEALYFNKNQKTAIAVAGARGVLMYLARKHGCDVYEYTPQKVKMATTGYGKSSKEQVADMVRRLVPGVKKDALDDEYDAIAVAITCLAIEG